MKIEIDELITVNNYRADKIYHNGKSSFSNFFSNKAHKFIVL